jgi:hypothetical protein
MKKLVILAFATLSVANAWQLKEVLDSEGIQTNVIQCDNGNIKAVYHNSKNGKYEITPTISFDILEDGAKYTCEE